MTTRCNDKVKWHKDSSTFNRQTNVMSHVKYTQTVQHDNIFLPQKEPPTLVVGLEKMKETYHLGNKKKKWDTGQCESLTFQPSLEMDPTLPGMRHFGMMIPVIQGPRCILYCSNSWRMEHSTVVGQNSDFNQPKIPLMRYDVGKYIPNYYWLIIYD